MRHESQIQCELFASARMSSTCRYVYVYVPSYVHACMFTRVYMYLDMDMCARVWAARTGTFIDRLHVTTSRSQCARELLTESNWESDFPGARNFHPRDPIRSRISGTKDVLQVRARRRALAKSKILPLAVRPITGAWSDMTHQVIHKTRGLSSKCSVAEGRLQFQTSAWDPKTKIWDFNLRRYFAVGLMGY